MLIGYQRNHHPRISVNNVTRIHSRLPTMVSPLLANQDLMPMLLRTYMLTRIPSPLLHNRTLFCKPLSLAPLSVYVVCGWPLFHVMELSCHPEKCDFHPISCQYMKLCHPFILICSISFNCIILCYICFITVY